MELISTGDLLYRGHNDREVLENAIAAPIINKILKQIVHLCPSLPDDELYLIKWEIRRGKMIWG